MLYEKGQKLKDLTFEQLLKLMTPRIDFHCKNNLHRFPGYDYDDLFQELSYKLWKTHKNNKIPKDIKYYDWRYLQYMNFLFRNRLLDLNRKFYNTRKKEPKDPLQSYVSLTSITHKQEIRVDEPRVGNLYERLMQLLE